jgi:hypothetical protein
MSEGIPKKEIIIDANEPVIDRPFNPEQADIEIEKDTEEVPNEKTPREWREKLRNLISGAGI